MSYSLVIIDRFCYEVNTNWNWGDVHSADLYLEQLERVRGSNYTSEQ